MPEAISEVVENAGLVKFTDADVERFWSRVKKSDGCWLWQGWIFARHGYGGFDIWKSRKKVPAHRFSWMSTNGPIPAGLMVLHRCDVRACVNPDHLFLGTAKDNADDRDAKGRANAPVGERAFGAKLTRTAIPLIRARAAIGETLVSIARDFGVHHVTIFDVVKRKTWKHL